MNRSDSDEVNKPYSSIPEIPKILRLLITQIKCHILILPRKIIDLPNISLLGFDFLKSLNKRI